MGSNASKQLPFNQTLYDLLTDIPLVEQYLYWSESIAARHQAAKENQHTQIIPNQVISNNFLKWMSEPQGNRVLPPSETTCSGSDVPEYAQDMCSRHRFNRITKVCKHKTVWQDGVETIPKCAYPQSCEYFMQRGDSPPTKLAEDGYTDCDGKRRAVLFSGGNSICQKEDDDDDEYKCMFVATKQTGQNSVDQDQLVTIPFSLPDVASEEILRDKDLQVCCVVQLQCCTVF